MFFMHAANSLEPMFSGEFDGRRRKRVLVNIIGEWCGLAVVAQGAAYCRQSLDRQWYECGI